MDAPRSTSITNLLMMLPMVVLPTLALLKMPDQEGSVMSKIVAACTSTPGAKSDTDPALEASAVVGQPPAGSDAEVDDLWNEISGGAPANPFAESPSVADALNTVTQPAAELLQTAAAITQPAVPAQGPIVSAVSLNASPSQNQMLAQLTGLGATRTMWFGPGANQFGFVAFVPSGPGMVSYRFEAIAATPEAAIADVATQVQRWKQQ